MHSVRKTRAVQAVERARALRHAELYIVAVDSMHVNNTIAQQRHGNYEVAMLGVVVVRRAGHSPIRMRNLNCPDDKLA